jgi:hypothetical protein
MLFGEEIAPCLVDQCPVRLERMSHRQLGRLQCLDGAKGITIELDRQDQRFPGMPHHG